MNRNLNRRIHPIAEADGLSPKKPRKRGDFYKKPTAYWFMNCKPTHGKSYQQLHKPKRIVDQPHEKGGGLCSEVRSMISPDYARNFICDFILGKEQEYSERSLFEE